MRAALQLQHRGQQPLGIGMLGIVEDRVHRAALDDAAELHHHHLLGDLGDDAHVMGDEHHRHAVAGLQLLDQLEDLGLGGDVERRGRLVGDQQLGLAGQRHGGHGALAHAAGEFEGIAVEALSRARNAHLLQHLDRPLPRLGLGDMAVQADRLDDLMADGMHRAQARHRLLEDHGDVAAADGAHLAPARIELGDIDDAVADRAAVGAVEQDLAARRCGRAAARSAGSSAPPRSCRCRSRPPRRGSCRASG